MTGSPQEPSDIHARVPTRAISLAIFRPVGIQIAIASAVVALVTFSTHRTLEQALRIFAATCLLFSFVSLVRALTGPCRPSGALSDWDQALILSLIAGGGHILAGLLT